MILYGDGAAEQFKLTFEVFNEVMPITEASLSALAKIEHLDFFSTDVVSRIASKEMIKAKAKEETNLDDYAGVYIFTSLADRVVLKVGQTKNLRRRIAKEHLRYKNDRNKNELYGYYYALGRPWPESIDTYQITLCVIPMAKKTSSELRSLEKHLKKLCADLR